MIVDGSGNGLYVGRMGRLRADQKCQAPEKKKESKRSHLGMVRLVLEMTRWFSEGNK